MLARHIPRAVLGGDWPGIAEGVARTVFDPFCGAGTVLLESQLAGLPAVGWDSNPLACLISRVKTQPVSVSALHAALARIMDRATRARDPLPPGVVNIDYWYSDHACDGLSRLASAVNGLRPGATSDVMRLALSKTAMQLSLANPRFPVPVKLRLDRYQEGTEVYTQLSRHLEAALTEDPIHRFESNVQAIADAMKPLLATSWARSAVVKIVERDVREPGSFDGSADLILTSPPYPGAQKYSRFSSLSLGWLGLTDNLSLRHLEDRLIGREHFSKAAIGSTPPGTNVPSADRLLQQVATENRIRAHIGATYLIEMRAAVKQLVSVLTPDGDLVVVVAPSSFVGRVFDTPEYLACMAKDERMKLVAAVSDPIRYRRLVTSRRGKAAPIAMEYLLHFRREP